MTINAIKLPTSDGYKVSVLDPATREPIATAYLPFYPLVPDSVPADDDIQAGWILANIAEYWRERYETLALRTGHA